MLWSALGILLFKVLIQPTFKCNRLLSRYQTNFPPFTLDTRGLFSNLRQASSSSIWKQSKLVSMAVPTEIPGPKGLPFLGNILDLQDEVPLRAVERLADIHGPIFKLNNLGQESVIVSGFDLFDELCDETRFYKLVGGKLRDLAGKDPTEAQGLFTSLDEKQEDWGQAHRILMPAFGPLAVAEMFPGMCPISSRPYGNGKEMNGYLTIYRDA